MVPSAHLLPGGKAAAYTRLQGGFAEATVVETDLFTSAVNAARANGRPTHAYKTYDSEFCSRSYLGCRVVPAALSIEEKRYDWAKL